MFEPEEKAKDLVVRIEFRDPEMIEVCITLGGSTVVLRPTFVEVGV